MMVTAKVVEGTEVQFRTDFSAALVGIEWETVGAVRSAAPDRGQSGYEFIQIRTRIGKRQRWSYRLAKVADLRTLTGDQIA